MAELESSLMATKASTREDVFFPEHAAARGGIGHLVATGQARAGIIRLQQRAAAAKALGATATRARPRAHGGGMHATSVALSASLSACTAAQSSSTEAGSADLPFWRTASRPATCGPMLGDAAALSSVIGCGAGMPAMARRSWESHVPHAHDFVATARSARAGDVKVRWCFCGEWYWDDRWRVSG